MVFSKGKDGCEGEFKIDEQSILRNLTEEQLRDRFEKHLSTKLSSDVVFDIQRIKIEIKIKNQYEYPSWLLRADKILRKIEKELEYEESKNSPQYKLMVSTFIATLIGIFITIIMGSLPLFIPLDQEESQSHQLEEHNLDTDTSDSILLPPQP